MTQEDKELLFKDLCARFPYGVIIERKLTNAPRVKYPTLRLLKSYMLGDFWQSIDNVITTPYLRPMSSMTEEEKREFDKFFNWDYGYMDAGAVFDVADWINAHHFDYRGLIEKGLAIEAPEGMYKEDEK